MMGEYSLLLGDNEVRMHIRDGVKTISLDAVKLDFMIASLEGMRGSISPPPATKVQPPKGDEMPINEAGGYQLPPVDDIHGCSLTLSREPHSTLVSVQYGSAHRSRPCHLDVPLRVVPKLEAFLRQAMAAAKDRGLD